MYRNLCVHITCRGRLSQLIPTISAWSNQDPAPPKIWVVDYGCPEGTFNRIKSMGLTHVAIIRVLDSGRHMNLGRARNIGLAQCPHELVFISDADIRPATTFVVRDMLSLLSKSPLVYPDDLGMIPGWNVHMSDTGTSLLGMKRQVWSELGGYQESFIGWGYDDIDFMERALMWSNQAGVTPGIYPHEWILREDHDDVVRTAHYPIKDRERSNVLNRRRSLASIRNHKHRANVGLIPGSANIEIWRGPES